jgi:hypothetical protein
MLFRYIFAVLLILATLTSAYGETEPKVPDSVYQDLEYVLSLAQSSTDLDPKLLSNLINFVYSTPSGSGSELNERQGASGAFYVFSVQGNFTKVIDYVYNPDIPLYVTMPSSLRQHQWLTPQIPDELRELPRTVESAQDIRLLRGRDQEVITPDTNTGGYYSYSQDRVVTILPGPTGPVLISVSSQNDISDIGKKGCIVGDDTDWNYLYSTETGLNKTGMGWVDSYMYYAHSVLIYVFDSSTNEMKVGSFKWLNGGWATMNMVNSNHILNGIKRFASSFKTIMETPGLPSPQVLADKYRELSQTNDQILRQMVAPYFEALKNSRDPGLDSDFFKGLVSSGKYLQELNHEELVQVLLLDYVKKCIGKEPLVHIASQPPSK